jgi:acyl-CoA dehydrogenase
MLTRRRTSAPSALAQPEGFREWPLNRTGPSAGCRKKTPATAQARPFRAESSHEAIQAFGSTGVSDEAGLEGLCGHPYMRFADGPDEVHDRAISQLELQKYANFAQ